MADSAPPPLAARSEAEQEAARETGKPTRLTAACARAQAVVVVADGGKPSMAAAFRDIREEEKIATTRAALGMVKKR